MVEKLSKRMSAEEAEKKLKVAEAELEFIHNHYGKEKNENLTKDALYTKIAVLEAERDNLKEQLKYALGDSSVEGEPRHYPFCDTCGRICHEITLPNTFIEEYTCHYCCERRDAEAEVKELTKDRDWWKRLTGCYKIGINHLRQKYWKSESRLAKAQDVVVELEQADRASFDCGVYPPLIAKLKKALGGDASRMRTR